MIVDYKKAQKVVEGLLRKKTGVVTGGFDILHHGHISLFEFGHKNVDVLFVGLDQDETLKISKGKDRPINNIKLRAKVVDAIKYVDYVFEIPAIYHLDYKDYELYKEMIEGLGVSYLISCREGDKLFEGKERLCRELGMTMLEDKREKVTSSTAILKKLED